MFNSLNNEIIGLITGLTNYVPSMLHATLTTLFIAAASLVIGLVLAFIFALLESFRFKPLAWLVSLFVITIRGLPEILVVIGIFNGIPLLLIMLSDGISIPLYPSSLTIDIQMNITNFNVSPVLCGIVALSLLYAAYASQTLRGAFKAVPEGQRQAAITLGLSRSRTLFRIVIPQMWRHALPGLSNQWLVLLKDTALVSLISVNDIMMQTKNIITNTKDPFTWYLIAAVIYLIISIISQKIIQRIEKRTLYFEQPTQLYNKQANQ